MNTLFNKIISAQNQTSFADAFTNNKVFCTHKLHDLVEDFEKIDFLGSIESLIEKWQFEVDIHLSESRDEHTTKTINKAAEAFKAFGQGQSLLFNDVNRQAPTLNPWLEDIRSALKLSTQTFSRCLVYLTPKDGGNAPHFDQNLNFVLQLRGEKTWWTAANTSVKNPVHRHVIGQETDPELESYSEEPMPSLFPRDAERFDLKPGSLIYVPPGIWHKTLASSDALSLNFTFTIPSLVDLISLAVRGRLTSSEIWREHALDLSHPDQIEKLDFLIQHLAADMQTWSAKDLVAVLED